MQNGKRDKTTFFQRAADSQPWRVLRGEYGSRRRSTQDPLIFMRPETICRSYGITFWPRFIDTDIYERYNY